MEPEQMPVLYPEDYNASLNGLGGWMAFVIIGRFLDFIYGIINLADLVTYAGSSGDLDVYYTVMIVLNVLVIILGSALILYFIFTRNILFRRIMVIQVIIVLTVSTMSSIYFRSLGYSVEMSEMISSLVSATIWVTYLYKSKRVKNTFIYPKQYPKVNNLNF